LVTFQNLDTLSRRRWHKALRRYPEKVRTTVGRITGATADPIGTNKVLGQCCNLCLDRLLKQSRLEAQTTGNKLVVGMPGGFVPLKNGNANSAPEISA
jgi:hypothetical protein